MELKELCCSFEYAQRLIEKGINLNLDTLFYRTDINPDKIYYRNESINSKNRVRIYAAPISGELDHILHRLGFAVHLTDLRKFDPDDANNEDGYWYDLLTLDLSDECAGIRHSFIFHNAADAKAHGLLWLVEQQIVNVGDIIL